MKIFLLFFTTVALSFLMPAFGSSEMETWINIRGEEVRVFSSSVEGLLTRGYFEQKTIEHITYSAQFDIRDVYFADRWTIALQLPQLDKKSLLSITIPRNVLDSTHGYNSEKENYNLSEYIVIVDDTIEIDHIELVPSKTHRTILVSLEPGAFIIEIVGTCITEQCHKDLT